LVISAMLFLAASPAFWQLLASTAASTSRMRE
jgi:hypothetical protein